MPGFDRSRWSLAREMLTRPFPLRPRVVVPAVTLMVLVPCYLVVAAMTRGRTPHLPELGLDRMIPVQLAWAPGYLSYFFVPFLPMLILRQEELIRRTFLAWLSVCGGQRAVENGDLAAHAGNKAAGSGSKTV